MSNLHPVGVFNDVTILDHKFGESKTGSIYFAVKFQTEYGIIWGDFYLTDKAAERSLEKIVLMGWRGTTLAELGDGTMLAGNLVQVTIEHDTYEGKTSSKIAWVNENHSVGKVTRDDAATASACRFDALARKVQQAAAPSDGHPAGIAQPQDDADVPF